ncbi:hypothetical protein SAMN04487968_104102 [Nocardioides terrae]|uniref:Glyoxalase-like domain-containing protein n=1 Tax=Nocardioides terrae TaxID=574651 RepID=A0A1I1H1X2_9ACTN|nr:VOC family protein [Nocardioides terrae]SFC16108.1 hypothetical protein SAMN04487968_104102 [Nocardioides terrae]
MALATFKDLVIDAIDAPRLGEFWAAVLGLEATTLDDGDLLLSGPTDAHAVWVNRVPEPVTVKQRVHLDVHAHSVDDVLALGATPADLESFAWKVLRDPEGGELCVFPRDEVPSYRLYEVVVDCHDPRRIATWWGDAFGVTAQHGDGYSWLERLPGAPFESLVFVPVPEPKTVKNRVHWDVTVGDLGLLTGDGATVLREQDDVIGWTVLADPEGNEFCAFTP